MNFCPKYNTAAEYFKHILLLPGQEIIFLCRNLPLNTDIPKRLEQKGIVTEEEFVLFSTGAMTMGSEILVIFAFQIFFGYIYFWIGIIVTLFLAGLLPGAWIGDRLKYQGQIVLVLTDILLILFLGIFIVGVQLCLCR